MNIIGTIREWKTKRFRVNVFAVEDYDIDLSFDDDGTVRDGIENGTLMAFGVIVRVTFDGVLVGEDSLWGCIYKNPREFMNHLGINRTGCGSYFSNMVRLAISEVRKRISDVQHIHIREA